MNDKIREEFMKRRARLAGQLIQGEDWPTAYRIADELLSWSSFEAGWLESRESLVIELPKEADESQGKNWSKAFNSALAQSRRALEAVGVKVAP